jgi:hypothetical protein
MSRFANLCPLTCALALAIALPAAADDGFTVTLSVHKTPSAAGQVAAILCDDPAARLPGSCHTYSAKADARPGATILKFAGVKPGVYAIQAFHDENGNGVFDFPREAYAFGNNAPFPPSFKAASITVAADTQTSIDLVSIFSSGAGLQGDRGVEAPADVAKADLRAAGLYGELYVPKQHAKPLPLVIAIGGSEGGLDTMSAFAVPLTAHGYAVLALAYWKEPGLPQSLEGVPLEYFDHAVEWARSQPGVAPDRIAILGWSRGAEAALLAASRNPRIHAVVAVSPTAYVWQGLNFSGRGPMKPAWLVAGAPLPSIVPANLSANESFAQTFVDELSEAERRLETAIPVEKINGPVLLLSGSEDALWPANLMSDRIIARLKANHFDHQALHRNFDGAGHAVFVGDPASTRGLLDATLKFMGGSAPANAKAQQESWPLVLDFLGRALGG